MPPAQGDDPAALGAVGGHFNTMPPVRDGGPIGGRPPTNPLDGLSAIAPGIGGIQQTMPPIGGSANGGNPLDALSMGAAPQPWRNGGPSGNPLEGLNGHGMDVHTPGPRAVPAQSRGMTQITKTRPGGRMY